jgi:hypothetical protein
VPEPFDFPKAVSPSTSRPLAVQASVDHLDLAANLHLEYGLGVVLTASSDPRRDPYAALETASHTFTERTGSVAQLDANRYAGLQRRTGASELSVEWARKQVQLGASTVVTDAGYIHDDITQVRDALAKAARLQSAVDRPLLAMLAISAPMLRKNRTELVDLVGGSSVAVGLALGHSGDPLASTRGVATLIELLGLGHVHPRRIDLSGIGALAFGAPGVAIGTTATLRHVYPSKKTSGGATSQWWSTLVPGTMTWRTHDRVMDAASTFTDHVFWQCNCGYCYGRSIAGAIRSAEAAIAHNFSTIATIADRVLSSSDPRTSWVQMCQHAQTYAYEVMAASGPGWEPQDYLGAWVSNRPVAVQS